jgi:hypothetical protein
MANDDGRQTATCPRSLTRAVMFGAACAGVLASLFFSNITVAGGGYRRVLAEALGFAAAADVLLVLVSWRAGIGCVAACVAVGLPTIWVLADALRRW